MHLLIVFSVAANPTIGDAVTNESSSVQCPLGARPQSQKSQRLHYSYLEVSHRTNCR
jgi:hypothetical protein